MLERAEHRELHENWNDFVKANNLHDALVVGEGGRMRLQTALEQGQISPRQIFNAMEQFYTEYGNRAALEAVRRLRGQIQPGLPF